MNFVFEDWPAQPYDDGTFFVYINIGVTHWNWQCSSTCWANHSSHRPRFPTDIERTRYGGVYVTPGGRLLCASVNARRQPLRYLFAGSRRYRLPRRGDGRQDVSGRDFGGVCGGSSRTPDGLNGECSFTTHVFCMVFFFFPVFFLFSTTAVWFLLLCARSRTARAATCAQRFYRSAGPPPRSAAPARAVRRRSDAAVY